MAMSSGGSSVRFLKNLTTIHPDNFVAIQALGSVLTRVDAALSTRDDEAQSPLPPRLVTLIPPQYSLSLLIDCYQAGLRHFGEIAQHELIRKAENDDVLRHCPDIKWHFYGNIQPSVATSRLVKTANLFMIESVHNETVATVLDQAAAAEKRDSLLKVMVQVANSEEEKQLGFIPSSSAHRLCRHIVEDCPYLELCGLMANPPASSPLPPLPNESSNNETEGMSDLNEELYQTMMMARLNVCRGLQMEVDDLELSMGGSFDFERAVEMGSSNVRIVLDNLGLPLPLPLELGGMASVSEDAESK